MSREVKMILTKPAKKGGGDKYESGEPFVSTLWLAQEDSRPDSGEPVKSVTILVPEE